MQTRPRHTIVVIPNEEKLDVSYYCTDKKITEKEKEEYVELIIQLHDCHSAIKIPKAKLKNSEALETLVHRTVINAKGHLCD